jgi:RND family efflux transporter MFP subunit
MRCRSTIVALSLATAVLSSCGGRTHAPAAGGHAPIAVTVAPVTAVDAAERLEAGGVVAAQASATVSSRIVATVVAIGVRPGDRVRPGYVLVTLDDRDVVEQFRQVRARVVATDKALAQARAEQQALEADHRLAAAWQQRIASLHARRSATDQERDEADARRGASQARLVAAQAVVEAAEAELAAARAGLGVAAANQAFTILRAPFAALVTERLTDPGNLAAPGVPLLRLESTGPRQVVVPIDDARARYFYPAGRVEVIIDAAGEGAPAGDRHEGVVAEVARAVGIDQRTFTVKIDIPPAITARSGSFARVVYRGAVRSALRVPATAIRRHGQVSSVFVVQDGVARLRLIRTGASSPDGVEVLAGLDAGEAVVISPAPAVMDGARVSVGGAS